MKRTILLFLLSSSLGSLAAPLALHPENPHYFFWKGKPTILVTSGEHYGALLNAAFDYKVYFGELAGRGLNHTRIFSGVYREVPGDFGITENPLAPLSGKYVAPWARSEEPGESDGGNKFDLTTWNREYFERLHTMMKSAEERGLVVEFTLFCPMYSDTMWKACPMNTTNNVNGIGNCDRDAVYALKHEALTDVQIAFTRKVVGELQDFENLYFEVCNEPYFGGVTDDWQRRIIDEIVATEKELPLQHLISQNIANGRKKVENPHPAVSIFNFHYCVPPDAVGMNYALRKVIGENETGFRGNDDLLYRTEAWDFLLAGGALYNNLDYSFTASHPAGTLRGYKSPGGGSAELRAQLGFLRRFLEGFDFVRMAPASGLVTKCDPRLSCSVLAEAGKAYAVYLHVPLPAKPGNLGERKRKAIEAQLAIEVTKGTYRIEWRDTKEGKLAGEASITHGGGALELLSPSFDDDIALSLVSMED